MYVFWWKKGHVHCESYLPVDAVLNMGGWATPKWFARQTSIAKPLSISNATSQTEKHFRTCSFWFSSCRALTRSWWELGWHVPEILSHRSDAKKSIRKPRASEAALMVIDQFLNTLWMCLIFRIAKVQGSFHLMANKNASGGLVSLPSHGPRSVERIGWVHSFAEFLKDVFHHWKFVLAKSS